MGADMKASMNINNEPISKRDLRLDVSVAVLLKMLTYAPCMLRFFVVLRLDLEPNLTF
jgi:hypothetical protein